MDPRRLSLVWRLLLMIGLVLGVGASFAVAQPAIEPSHVEGLVYPGGALTVEKTVWTPEIPPNPVIVFLADTTGSMGPAIANVKANATSVMNAVVGAQPTAQFAVAEYRDFGDVYVYQVTQMPTANTALVQAAINGWTAWGGGDTPEAQLYALSAIATGAAGIVFAPNTTPIIAWFGDAPGHDPSGGATLASTMAALASAGIRVVAVDTPASGPGLNLTGQAAAIASATGGALLTAPSANDVADKILEGLQNLPVKVEMTSSCVWPITTTFSPAGPVVVTSGQPAVFWETISVASDAAPGIYYCRDWALIDGQPMTDANGLIIYEAKTIRVPGLTLDPPVATNEYPADDTHTVIATVAVPDWGPVEGAEVTFEVIPGSLNAGLTGGGSTDANGEVAFTYQTKPLDCDDLPATDTIVAQLLGPDGEVVAKAEALKRWVDTTPPVPVCVECENPAGKKLSQNGQSMVPAVPE